MFICDKAPSENPTGLNLATELWSADQTRLTLLLDRGRIKRGVGPNQALRVPLEGGRDYRLVIDAAMRDARGRPLDEDHVRAFRTGPAERRAIDPHGWAIEVPPPGSRAKLHVVFDRLIDRANAARTIRPLEAAAGEARTCQDAIVLPLRRPQPR